MKILFVISQFHPFKGGAEIFLHRLSCEMQVQGHEILVLTPQLRADLKLRENIDGVDVCRFPRLHIPWLNKTGFNEFVESASMLRTLLSLKFKPDVCCVFMGYGNLPFLIHLRKKIGYKALIVRNPSSGVHDPFLFAKNENAFFRYSVKCLIKKLSACVVTNEVAKDTIKSLGVSDTKVQIIENAFPLLKEERLEQVKCLEKLDSALRIPSGPLCVYIGNMSFVKGVDVLLSAWELLIKNESSAGLWLIGNGAMQEELKDRIFEKRLGNSVQISSGFIENTGEILSYADILIQPSRAEGMSNTLLEALAHGKPVIVSDIEANLNVIGVDNKVGWSFSSEDYESLSQTVLKAFDEKEKWLDMGDEGQKLARERFSLLGIAKKYEGLFLKLMEMK